jgi:hypothetical protein
MFKGLFWYIFDIAVVYFFSKSFLLNSKFNHFSFDIKLKQINNNNFYQFNNNVNLSSLTQTYLYGLRSVWKHLRL